MYRDLRVNYTMMYSSGILPLYSGHLVNSCDGSKLSFYTEILDFAFIRYLSKLQEYWICELELFNIQMLNNLWDLCGENVKMFLTNFSKNISNFALAEFRTGCLSAVGRFVRLSDVGPMTVFISYNILGVMYWIIGGIDIFAVICPIAVYSMPMPLIDEILAPGMSSSLVRFASHVSSRLLSDIISSYDTITSYITHCSHLTHTMVEVLSVVEIDPVALFHFCLATVGVVSFLFVGTMATKGGIVVHIHTHNDTHNHNTFHNYNNTTISSGSKDNGYDHMYYGKYGITHDMAYDMEHGMTHGMDYGKYIRNFDILNFLPTLVTPSDNLSENITVMTAQIETVITSDSDQSGTEEVDSEVGVLSDDEEKTSVAGCDEANLRLPSDPLKLHCRSPLGSPSQRIERRLRSSRNNSISSIYSVDSVSSQPDSQDTLEHTKADRSKWIEEDGVYDLDLQQQTCKFGYVKGAIEQHESETLLAMLSNLIPDTCKLDNTERYRINFTPSSSSAVITDPPRVSTKKFSVCNSNINKDCELNTVVSQYREKIQKKVAAVFDEIEDIDELELDHVIVHNLSGDKDSMSYESFFDADKPAFSPIVAVLSLGTKRAMFLKPKNSNSISHRVELPPGTLCVFAGQTECKFRHSIPKNFGEPCGQHMTLFFIEKVPAEDRLKSLLLSNNSVSLDHSSVSDVKIRSTPCGSSSPVDKLLLDNNNKDDQLRVKPPFLHSKKTSQKGSLDDHTLVSDDMDFEDDSVMLLAETLRTAINSMDELSVDVELKRNKLSSCGATDIKRRRLATALHLRLGELANRSQQLDPIKLLKFESVDSFSKQDVTDITNTQKHIEECLITMVDDMIDLKVSVALLQPCDDSSGTNTSSSDKKKKKKQPVEIDDLDLNNKINFKDCAMQIKNLTDIALNLKLDLAVTQNSMDGIKEVVKETIKDIEAWYKSAFYSEDSGKIGELHDLMVKKQQVHQSDELQNKDGPAYPKPQSDEFLNNVDPAKQQSVWDTPPTPWMIKKPLVCLITDSIMRHITAKDLGGNYSFNRIDRRNSSGLGHNDVVRTITKLRPDFLFIHLGINDIFADTPIDQTINNFSQFESFLRETVPNTRVVFSLPLLTGYPEQYDRINELRRKLTERIGGINRKPGHKRYMDVQFNRNFFADEDRIPRVAESARQLQRMFGTEDTVHLSPYGKKIIAGNMRDVLFRITR